MMLLMVLHSLEYLKAHVLGTHIFLIYNILTTFQLSVSQKEFLNLFADDMHVSL